MTAACASSGCQARNMLAKKHWLDDGLAKCWVYDMNNGSAQVSTTNHAMSIPLQ
jgi:hypothetical protein